MIDKEDRIIKFDDELTSAIKEQAKKEGKTFKELVEELLELGIKGLRRKQRMTDILADLRQDADIAGLSLSEYIRELSIAARELGVADAIREKHGIAKKDD